MSASVDSADVGQGFWSRLGGGAKIGICGGVVGLFALSMFAPPDFWLGSSRKKQAEPTQQQSEESQIKDFPRSYAAQKKPQAANTNAQPPAEVPQYQMPSAMPIGLYAAPSGTSSAPPPPQQPQYAAPNMPPDLAALEAANGARRQGPSSQSLVGQVSDAVALPTAQASIMANPDYIIPEGWKIPCLMDATRNTGGFVSCTVPGWIPGTTLNRNLIPPGSTIFGQIKEGMMQGQEVQAIIFTRIETSGDHFKIHIAAPGADMLGRSGVPVDRYDTHFWSTAGAVGLYALIDAGQNLISGLPSAALAAASNGKGIGFLNLGGIGGGSMGGQSLAAMTLQNRMNRPPSAETNNGKLIMVSVGQDLDFHDACVRYRRINPNACPLR
jgi:type IV secretory pathway VirB10-like protein